MITKAGMKHGWSTMDNQWGKLVDEGGSNMITKADDRILEIVGHLNLMESKPRMILLNAIVWMLVDNTVGTKHDKVGILETTKFKIMGDEYGRYNSKDAI
jgi:hypothetical protein